MRKSENLEQVLDILVVLSGQVLVLQQVPHRVKLVISFLNGSTDRCSQRFPYMNIILTDIHQRAGFQPILVQLSSHQWLR